MKNKNKKTALLLRFLRNSKRYFALSICFVFLINILNLTVPKIIAFTIDNLINAVPPKSNPLTDFFLKIVGGIDHLRENIGLMGAVLVVFAFLGAIFQYLNEYWNTKGAEILIKNIRDDVYEHINKLPFAFHTENKTGDIIQRCTTDIDTIKNFLSKQISELLRTLVLIILSVYFMFTINVKLTLIAAILLPVNLLVSYFGHKKIAEAHRRNEEEEGRLSSIAQENIAGVRVVRAFGREAYEIEKFEAQNTVFFQLWKKMNILFSTFWSTIEFISNLQIILIAVVGSVFAFRGELLAGEYVAFVAYNLMLSWPIMSLSRLISDFSKASVSMERLQYILNAAPEEDTGKRLTPSMKEDIEFKNVSFSYLEDTKIFDRLSFRIKAGEAVGILGGTGVGKSTLMYLLTRLYTPTEGEITIGDVNISDIELSYLRENIGFVLQEPFLFSGTISENIALGGHSPDESSIRRAATDSSLLSTIEDFSKGFDTFVGEKGVTLSGGQKQRVAIARMIIGDTPIMLFDDSLSAVDTETDSKIRKALKERNTGSTTLIISHRITTLMNADKIIVLDKGRISEMGTHEELLKNNGIYKKIYDIQYSHLCVE